MAANPPPEGNKSVDLQLAASARRRDASGQGDLQVDGLIVTKAAALMRNVQSGRPPVNPNLFPTQFNIQKGSSNIFNIVNSQNVQIGHTNIVNQYLRSTGNNPDSDSDSDSDDNRQLALEPDKIVELRKCEKEISNGELVDIASHVGLGWRRLIRFLGLQEYDVDELYEEYSSRGLEEVVYQLLRRWKAEEENPTVSEMLNQLQRCDMDHLAQYLKVE